MDILTPISFIFDNIKGFFDELCALKVSVGVGEVPLPYLFISFIILSMIISVWWKGAKG